MDTNLSLEELQARFKAIQQESSHRLSERNCVEIVMKLIEIGLLDVIFTLNGREYITPKQLEREILEELLQSKGRINVVELQPLLNVDLSHIEKKVAELVKRDKQLQLVDGELLSSFYLDGIAIEINDFLQEEGEVNVIDLSKRFNLNPDILQTVIERKIGKTIHGQLEKGVLYTDLFVQRHNAQVRGALSALTRPTLTSEIIAKHNFQEKLFYQAVDVMIKSGELNGSLQGRKERTMFTPTVFSFARQQWVDSFFAQNGYIEYYTLERLQFTNPRGYLESHFKDGIPLKTCFLNRSLVNQVDLAASEILTAESWVDLLSVVPSILSSADLFVITQSSTSIQQQIKLNKLEILQDHYLVSKGLLDKCTKAFESDCKEKAAAGKLQKIEEPKASQEPEETNKSTKSKRTSKRSTEQEEQKKAKNQNQKKIDKQSSQSPLQETEILKIFKIFLEDAPEELLDAIMDYLRPSLISILQQVTRSVFVQNASSKEKMAQFVENVHTLHSNILLFQKGLQFMNDDPVIEKYVLKTTCFDLTNMLLENQALNNYIKLDKKITTMNDQTSLLSQLSGSTVPLLQKLISSCNGKSIAEFLSAFDTAADAIGLQCKQYDKKRERQLIAAHREALMQQLTQENDPATCLHLVVVLLVLKKHSVVIHAPGRTVANILTKLKPDVPQEVHSLLNDYQSHVVKYLLQKQTNPDAPPNETLVSLLPKIKEIVLGHESSNNNSNKE